MLPQHLDAVAVQVVEEPGTAGHGHDQGECRTRHEGSRAAGKVTVGRFEAEAADRTQQQILGARRLQELATALAEGDVDGLVSLLTEGVTWSMPPQPHWYRGCAAVAFYLGGSATVPHEAWSITVLTLRDDRICDLTSFLGAEHFPAFGLPATVTP